MARIAFIGAGRMARAIAGGLITKGNTPPADIGCTSASDGTGKQLAQDLGITHTLNLMALLADAEVIILACKPQQLGELDAALRQLTSGKFIISILAGTRIERLREKFPAAHNIVRTMPNTPGQIGAGVTAYTPEKTLLPEQTEHLERIVNAMGRTFPVEEAQLDAVTAISGSGPAYVFEFIAALREAGIQQGLPEQTSLELALHTVLGAAQLLQATGETPENLRIAVTSPGGTTAAGLQVMESRGFRDIMAATVQAARKRSEELSA